MKEHKTVDTKSISIKLVDFFDALYFERKDGSDYIKRLKKEFEVEFYELFSKNKKENYKIGTLYTEVYNDKYFYSSLTHSVAVALIIWNFTHDKK